MDEPKLTAASVYVRRIEGLIEDLAGSPAIESLKHNLAELNTEIGIEFSVNLQCALEIYDSDRKQSLSLLKVGLTSLGGEELYGTREDLSLQRYLALNEIRIVPNEYCPICWGRWVSKLLEPKCSHCTATLGEEVKILLDSSICPNCLAGKISSTDFTCDECHIDIDPEFVV